MVLTELQYVFISWNKKHIQVGCCDHPENNSLWLWRKVKTHICNQDVDLSLVVTGEPVVLTCWLSIELWRAGTAHFCSFMSGPASDKYFRGTQVSLLSAKSPLYLEPKGEVSFLLSVGAVSRRIPRLFLALSPVLRMGNCQSCWLFLRPPSNFIFKRDMYKKFHWDMPSHSSVFPNTAQNMLP